MFNKVISTSSAIVAIFILAIVVSGFFIYPKHLEKLGSRVEAAAIETKPFDFLNFETLEYIQERVYDNQLESWRLDPVSTAKRLSGFKRSDEFNLIAKEFDENNNTYVAEVEVKHNGKEYIIQLIQPVRKGPGGIWVINDIRTKKSENKVDGYLYKSGIGMKFIDSISGCDGIYDSSKRFACRQKLIRLTFTIQCDEIEEEEKIDCYLNVCNKISKSDAKTLCMSDVAKRISDPFLCSKLPDINDKSKCYLRTIAPKDFHKCEKLPDQERKNCYRAIFAGLIYGVPALDGSLYRDEYLFHSTEICSEFINKIKITPYELYLCKGRSKKELNIFWIRQFLILAAFLIIFISLFVYSYRRRDSLSYWRKGFLYGLLIGFFYLLPVISSFLFLLADCKEPVPSFVSQSLWLFTPFSFPFTLLIGSSIRWYLKYGTILNSFPSSCIWNLGMALAYVITWSIWGAIFGKLYGCLKNKRKFIYYIIWIFAISIILNFFGLVMLSG